MPIRPENRDRYPADWKDIRARILARAASSRGAPRCECLGECGGRFHNGRCGAGDGEPHPYTGSRVVLTIAHLDHTPEHCAPENLRAMCQACHLAYDADHHATERARNAVRDLEAAGQARLFA